MWEPAILVHYRELALKQYRMQQRRYPEIDDSVLAGAKKDQGFGTVDGFKKRLNRERTGGIDTMNLRELAFQRREPRYSVELKRDSPFIDPVRNRHTSRHGYARVKQEPYMRSIQQVCTISFKKRVFRGDSAFHLRPNLPQANATALAAPPIIRLGFGHYQNGIKPARRFGMPGVYSSHLLLVAAFFLLTNAHVRKTSFFYNGKKARLKDGPAV
jgi:hypothetical protein